MTHGPVCDAVAGLDYEESEHSGRMVRRASVAALGGLLFGYDSAVINGAVSSIEKTVETFGTADSGGRDVVGARGVGAAAADAPRTAFGQRCLALPRPAGGRRTG